MNVSVILTAAATPTAPPLTLRPWRPDDIPALIEAYQDPALRRGAAAPLESEGDVREWMRMQEEGWATGDRFGFAVLETSQGAERLVGNVVLKGVAAESPGAEVGYWTAAVARGHGVAPRALETLTTWAFDTFRADGLERLELLHQVDNAASCRVAEKTGYAFDRILAAWPPTYPLDGHLHVRTAAGKGISGDARA
ncbi:acetyltransferase [Streptomyces sp. ERV7]|uniref:GNAT family N-acetyltransferase n=1 Tax=Streptomyces sp. ERV7 TaxID=1322334 RepID=UPI0007F517CB|nr:GNAT family N-acetyltransferase [Streptomyces sp. ERV7]OAR22777.1 acetyltransferase [Streptomyces sp. ERV7]